MDVHVRTFLQQLIRWCIVSLSQLTRQINEQLLGKH